MKERPWRLVLIPIVGALVTCGSFAFAMFVVRPLFWAIKGTPAGFGEDYTTWQAVGEAFAAQGLTLIPMFMVVGILMNVVSQRVNWRQAILLANPITVFGGYWLYYRLCYTGENLDVELLYFRLSSAVVWSVAALVVLAPAAVIARRWFVARQVDVGNGLRGER